MEKNKIMEDLMPYFVEGAVQQELIKEMGEYGETNVPEENPKHKKTRALANMITDACYKMDNADRSGVEDEMVELLAKQAKEIILKAVHELGELWSGKDEEEEKEPETFAVELGPGIKVMSPKGIGYEVENVTEDFVFLNDGNEVWKVAKSIVETWIK